ncbi:MAG: hypothetical protein D6770_11090 [Anaerolineae bacterium]|nr:MAG: hypothetical protein D6770_11090 [Anaerolineae bacterium]
MLAFLVACATPTPPPHPQTLTIYATAAAQPWLNEAYHCAAPLSEGTEGASPVLRRVADPAEAAIVLRLGEPPHLLSPAYAIGEAHLEIIVHRGNPVAALDTAQVEAIFGGRAEDWAEVGGEARKVQVWVYAEGTDVQEAFRIATLRGGAVTSLARQAWGPEAMLEAVANDESAIGFLPHRWLSDEVRPLSLPDDLRAALTVPVLAITPEEPQETAQALLACLQRLAKGK